MGSWWCGVGVSGQGMGRVIFVIEDRLISVVDVGGYSDIFIHT